MSLSTTLRVVRLSAICDLVVTVGFAFAITATVLFDSLAVLHDSLGLTGATPDPSDPFVIMFANLMGSVVAVWAVFRILRPSLLAGAVDIGARILFSIGMTVALIEGALPLVIVMLALEIVWAVAQSIAIVAARRAGASNRTLTVDAPATAF
jgi:hypothetical protein